MVFLSSRLTVFLRKKTNIERFVFSEETYRTMRTKSCHRLQQAVMPALIEQHYINRMTAGAATAISRSLHLRLYHPVLQKQFHTAANIVSLVTAGILSLTEDCRGSRNHYASTSEAMMKIKIKEKNSKNVSKIRNVSAVLQSESDKQPEDTPLSLFCYIKTTSSWEVTFV